MTVGEIVAIRRENESICIPLGEVHRLGNLGKIMLELIEVHSSYLGEDDIIQIADEFGRS